MKIITWKIIPSEVPVGAVGWIVERVPGENLHVIKHSGVCVLSPENLLTIYSYSIVVL